MKFGITARTENNPLAPLPGVLSMRCHLGHPGWMGREESLASIMASFKPQLPSSETVWDVDRAWAPLEENTTKRRATGRWRPVIATTFHTCFLPYRASPNRLAYSKWTFLSYPVLGSQEQHQSWACCFPLRGHPHPGYCDRPIILGQEIYTISRKKEKGPIHRSCLSSVLQVLQPSLEL